MLSELRKSSSYLEGLSELFEPPVEPAGVVTLDLEVVAVVVVEPLVEHSRKQGFKCY